ncbi:MAG: hypothetical protein GXP37_06710 [Chloroflexi bacterium]|nr:hypothetical protein [Chloroflexota bacterium]
MMLAQIHEHIVNELGQSSRTDTIFVVTAILFNLIVLGVNSAVAASASGSQASGANDFVLAVFILMTVLINAVAVMALTLGRRTRQTLLDGLMAMYADNDVDQYYDPSLLANYGTRYMLFASVIILLAITAIVVPLILRWM